jgi:PAS domain S-box-containing protein
MKQAETHLFSLTRTQQYGIAIFGVVIATVIRWALDSILGEQLPFFFYVFPLVIAAAVGGLGPGLLATGFSLLLGDFFFIAPRGSLFVFDTPSALIQGASVAFIGLAFSVLFDWSQKSLKAEWIERKASEERLVRITDFTHDALWEIDLKAKQLWWNEGARSLFGSSPGELRMNLERWYARVHPEDAERVRRRFESFMQEGGCDDWEDEYRFRLADDHYVYILDRGHRFRDEAGALVRIAGAMVDITEGKLALAERERLLAEIESERDRLRQILDQMPIGVAIAEAPSGRLIFHNRRAILLLRHPMLNSPDYTAYTQYGAFHEDGTPYRAGEYPAARSLLSGEVVSGEEMRYRRGDGTETFFSVDSAPIFGADGRMVMTVATFIDIAERKRAEEALRESEERFSKAFRASPDSLIISRLSDALIIEVNDSFVALTGYSRDEIVGQSATSLGLLVDPGERQRLLEILSAQGCIRDRELRMRRKSGEIRLILFSAEPIELRGEHCWLTMGQDITESKLAEEELQRLFHQEKAAREEAETANRMKDEFLATVSHELRTPLTSIMGWASMLLNASMLGPQARHALEVIVRSAKSQSELIDDVLDMARIVKGRLKLDARPVEIESIFHAAVEIIRPVANAKRITLQVLALGCTCKVYGDASRLQQAIWNLLSNAVKFTGEGGHIEAQLAFSPAQAEISITDDGIGIEPQFLPYVFERFRQADSSSTRTHGGLGLGLAIVHRIVEVHGGVVSAFSPGKGRGSTFRIILPLMKPADESTPIVELERGRDALRAVASKEGPTLDQVRILVVEDDADTLNLLKFVLDDSGADVVTAPSVSEALDVFEHWRPDVLVSDIAMPGQDGYQLIGQVRSRGNERGGNIPAVALTAFVRNEDKERALAAGFQMHLTKPIAPKELITALANLSGRTH